MTHDTTSSTIPRQALRAQERTRSISPSQEDPALVEVRRLLGQVSQDLRTKSQDLEGLACGLRTTRPGHGSNLPHPDGTTLSVEEWAADCADVVADGLVGLAELAETFAQSDWKADVMAWLDEV